VHYCTGLKICHADRPEFMTRESLAHMVLLCKMKGKRRHPLKIQRFCRNLNSVDGGNLGELSANCEWLSQRDISFMSHTVSDTLNKNQFEP
jgi:hypothetical protein